MDEVENEEENKEDYVDIPIKGDISNAEMFYRVILFLTGLKARPDPDDPIMNKVVCRVINPRSLDAREGNHPFKENLKKGIQEILDLKVKSEEYYFY
ncbi:hypothetical protein ABW19_dt0208161 [Dactylella cylindrospora]|nr:hypothetical protein ABW19_dt0208161 [Dactylella cylindrospora]